MKRHRTVYAAILSVLLFSLALEAEPATPLPVQRQPGVPIHTCNTGPVPAWIAVPQRATYVDLAWLPVAGAVQFTVSRNDTTANHIVTLSPPGFTGIYTNEVYKAAYEFWDAVPDPRDTYIYSVTAIQANGCYGTASMTIGPTGTPNPDKAHAVRTGPTTAKLVWHAMFGALQYRVDGPGMPSTGQYIPGGSYTPPKEPTLTLPPGTNFIGNQSETFWSFDMVLPLTNIGTGASTYTVVAMYPGNYADYVQKTAMTVPAMQPCSVFQASPNAGQTGTIISVTGTGFSFAGQVGIEYDANRGHEYTLNRTITSDSLMAVNTSVLQMEGVQPAPATIHIHGPLNTCDFRFSVLPVPPPPPTQARVPGIVGDALANAQGALQRAGFMLGAVNGPGDPGAVVVTQTPQGGAMAAPGSAVGVATLAPAGGISQVNLYNNTGDGHSVNLWLFDGTTGQMSATGSVAPNDSTTVSLPAAHLYTIFAVDPADCGGQNDPANVSCDRWQQSFIGDPNGSPFMTSIN